MKIDLATHSEISALQQNGSAAWLSHSLPCYCNYPINMFIEECKQVLLRVLAGFFKIGERFLANQKKMLGVAVLKAKTHVSIFRQIRDNWNLQHGIGSQVKKPILA